MEYWATTGGLALGLPISFGLAGIVQLTRWRAAKLAQPIPQASEVDQDAFKKERAAKDAVRRPKLKMALMAVCFALYMGFLFCMDRMTSMIKLGFWGGLAGLAISTHVGGFFTHLTGVVGIGLARHSNKELRIKDRVDSWTSFGMVVSVGVAMTVITMLVPFFAPGDKTLAMAAFAFFAATIPYRVMTNTSRISNKPATPLKWRLFGMAVAVIGMLGLFTFIWAIVTAFALAFPGKESEPKTPKKEDDPAFLKAFMKIMIHCFFPLQFCTLFGSVGGVLMPAFRVDWLLANKKTGVQLEDNAGIEREKEIFSETRALGDSVDEIDRKDLGELVVVPSFAQLVMRGQIGHFLAKPVYTGTAMLTIQATMFGCTWMGKRLVEVLEPVTKGDFPEGTATAMMSSFAALFLLPFTLTPVLAIVSSLRGDFSLLFNHRADFGVHSSGEGETEPLLDADKEVEDEKVKLGKKDIVDVSS